jgi:hypothetical protein
LTLTERRNTTSGGALVWKREVKYDKRGRIYQRILYPATGTQKLTEDLWYDQAQNVIKRRQPGSAGFEKFLYDALGRLSKRYTAYGTDSTYSAVQNVSNNTVMRQEEFGYDDAGNRTRKLVRDRYHNESASNLGELGTPTDSLRKARVTCVGYWPEGLGRPQAEADYGTNGIPDPWSWTRPDLIPATSSTVLVSRYAHEITGELESVTVPSGTSGTQVTRREYDQAGRLIRLLENYLSGQSGPDKNKTTEFEYTADGNLKKLRAKSTTPGDQVTEWIYGTTLTDSDVASNALVRQKIYPDSTGASDRVYLKWNRQSEPREFLDQATTVHTLQYDKLGRMSAGGPLVSPEPVFQRHWLGERRGWFRALAAVFRLKSELEGASRRLNDVGAVAGGGAQAQRLLSCPAPHLRPRDAGERGRHRVHPAVARAREARHHGDLHRSFDQTASGGPRPVPPGITVAGGPEDRYTGTMNTISKKIVVDEKGAPVEVILPWATFCDVVEQLGLDLDAEAEADLRQTRHDLEAGTKDAFLPLSSL